LLLRGQSGIMIGDYHVTPIQLCSELRTLPQMDNAKLDVLFNNKDHMNIKNAVTLLSAIHDLSVMIGFETTDLDKISFVVLGSFTGFFVRPFKTPSMTLSEQLESLSALAHMMFILFCRHRTSFCPGQLYYNVQTMLKNIFWVLAKQKLLDDSLGFYITQAGEDRLKVNFGIYRLMDNSQNVDILQLSQRASTAIEIMRIFV
jgi:hypothetical protein